MVVVSARISSEPLNASKHTRYFAVPLPFFLFFLQTDRLCKKLSSTATQTITPHLAFSGRGRLAIIAQSGARDKLPEHNVFCCTRVASRFPSRFTTSSREAPQVALPMAGTHTWLHGMRASMFLAAASLRRRIGPSRLPLIL